MGKLTKVKSGIFTFYLDTRQNIFFQHHSQNFLIAKQGVYKLSNGDYVDFIDAIYRKKITNHDQLFSKLATLGITFYATDRKLN